MNHRRPNIVLLVPDELNTRAVGCYGQPLPVTPFLDGLAAHAAVFDNYFTCHPKCVPARASLLTATYPHVHGHRTLDLPVRPHEPNLVRHLRRSGYYTAMVGRNHMCDAETLPQTFEEYLPADGAWTLEPADPDAVPPGSYLVGHDPTPLAAHCDVVRTDAALDWLHRRGVQDQPFYLQVNYNHPHPPYSVPSPYYGRIDRDAIQLPPMPTSTTLPRFHNVLRKTYQLERMTEDQWRELIACYLEMTTFIDDQLQRVYDALAANGQLDNTLFVVWVDHGDFAGEFGLTEKWDTAMYDCITHVPFFIHAPAHVRAQRVSAFMETVDVLPTLLDLAGVDLPRGIQGQSFVPVLKGEVNALKDSVICQGGQEMDLVLRPTPVDAKPRPCLAYLKKQEALVGEPTINLKVKMLRDRRFKYMHHLHGVEELYDLEADPFELHNRADDPAYAEHLQAYRLKLLTRLIETETAEPYQEWLDS